MAKYELTNDKYHISLDKRIPKYGIFIMDLEKNEYTNFFIIPTTINKKINSKLSNEKKLILDYDGILIEDKDIPLKDFTNILSLARQIAINTGNDLILNSNIAKKFHVTNQVEFKNFRLPMTSDEIRQMESITISPRINSDGIYWQRPNKNSSIANYLRTLENYIPENIETKLDFKSCKYSGNIPLRICVIDDNKKSSSNFSNIEIKNINNLKENKIDIIISELNLDYNIYENIKFPKCYESGKNKKRLNILGYQGIKTEKSLESLNKNFLNNDSILVDIDFDSRYRTMFEKFNEAIIFSEPIFPSCFPFEEKVDGIYKELKKNKMWKNYFSYMKEFSELKELFEDEEFQNFYHDEFNYSIPSGVIFPSCPRNIKEYIRYYDEKKDIFEEIIRKEELNIKRENNIECNI